MNYASRIRMPVLMLQGRYDLAIPLESETRPVFDFSERHPLINGYRTAASDHWYPRNDLIRESLAWLDEYLGPVALAGPSPPERGPRELEQ